MASSLYQRPVAASLLKTESGTPLNLSLAQGLLQRVAFTSSSIRVSARVRNRRMIELTFLMRANPDVWVIQLFGTEGAEADVV